MKNEISISFTPEMVRAILDGRKTQTRRPVKGACSILGLNSCNNEWPYALTKKGYKQMTCPYGEPGDLLWVKEPYMNLQLDITVIRAQRLQDISEEDAIAEGVKKGWDFDEMVKHIASTKLNNRKKSFPSRNPYQLGFIGTWCNIYSLDNWFENPIVWVITFNKYLGNVPVINQVCDCEKHLTQFPEGWRCTVCWEWWYH